MYTCVRAWVFSQFKMLFKSSTVKESPPDWPNLSLSDWTVLRLMYYLIET